MLVPVPQEAYRQAAARAKTILKPGDRVRVQSCAGIQTYTFKGWTGPRDEWLDTASGYDLHPFNISKVNGQAVSFRDHAAQAA